MKTSFYISLFSFVVLTSCTNTKTTSAHDLKPALYVNGQEFNSAILNYDADYGFDGRDGDVGMGEIEIRISELDEGSKFLKISGYLSGKYLSNTEEKLSSANNAIINLLDSKREQIKGFRGGSNGDFDIAFDYQEGQVLEFSYIGYRTLYVELSTLLNSDSD